LTGRILDHPLLELAIRWVLGVTFVYSSVHKIAAPDQFARILFGYALFPPGAINLIAIAVPFVELFTGAALLLGIWPRATMLVVETLLLLFLGILTINLVRGVEFDCGCFGFGEAGHTSTIPQYLVRDAVYFLGGLQVLLFKGRRRWCLAPAEGTGPSAATSR
jgi:uncharacterized membrane protein YphA (DoxX/SURF4 family)